MDEIIARSGFEPGTIIAGKYRIDRWLAEGGMGFVVAGTHLTLDQPVALKFLRQGMSLQPEALARFTREGKAAALLRSEYVARVFDAGVTDEGMPYMAMEYLEGESLAFSLQRQGVLDVSSAAEYIVQACEGLAEAHSRAIVHRDIKPYNLFLVERAVGWRAIKVLDFGISKASFADATHIATSSIIGSPCYMSPEQLRSSASVDHRTDIWSLGATLYELLAGKSAFDAYLSLPEIVASILANPAPDVRELRPGVPLELAAIIVRCLAKNRHVRFQSAGELAMALLPFAPPRAHVPAERAASMAPAPPADRVLNVATGSFPMLPGGEGQWLDFAESLGGRATRTEFAVRSEEGGPTKTEPGGSTAPLALSVAGSEALENLEVRREKAPAPTKSIRGWAAAASIALGVGAVLVAVLVGPRVGATKSATFTAANASPSASATPPDPGPIARLTALPEEAERVELVVRVSPPQSRLTVDDQPVENPYRVTYPKDGPSHSIEARAWGYEPRSEVVSLARDTVVDLELERHVQSFSVTTTPASRANRVTPESSRGSRGSASAATAAPAKQDITSAGGHSPLRPIEVNDPYGAK